MTKFCSIKLLQYDENEVAIQIGETQKIDLAQYVGKKDKQVSIYFYPTNSQIQIVKVDATLSIRPSNSKVTSGK